MKDEKIYYKISYPESLILFYHDLENDKLDGVIEEAKTNNKLVIQKHMSVSCYNNVLDNTLASSMIKKAKQITEEEYNIAVSVVEAMIGSDEWLISDNDYKEVKKEVVTETVYV